MKRMKRTIVMILALVMALSITACSGGGSGKTAANAGTTGGANDKSTTGVSQGADKTTGTAAPSTKSTKDTIRISIDQDPERLGLIIGNGAATAINANLYAKLVEDAPKGRRSVAVTKLEPIDDLHYKMVIRDDIYCTDGHHITAEDIKWCIQWTVAESPSVSSTNHIDVENIEIVDDYTLIIPFTEKLASFRCEGEFINFYITWEGAVKENPLQPAGTGQYKLVEWLPGSQVTLVANDDYFGEKPYIKNVVYKVIREDAQKLNSLMAGEIDLVQQLPVTDLAYVDESPDFKSVLAPGYISQCIFFNVTENSIMSNKTLREAVCYAVDNESIIDIAYGGVGEVSKSFISKGLLDYQSEWSRDDYYPYNLNKAKELIDSCNIDWTKNKIVIATDGSLAQNTTAQIIQKDLESLGATVEITNYEASAYGALKKDPTAGWDIFLSRITCGSGYSCDLLDAFLNSKRLNYSGWSNNEFDELISSALADYDTVGLENTKKALDLVHEIIPGYAFMEQSVVYAAVKDLNMDEAMEKVLLFNNVDRVCWLFFE